MRQFPFKDGHARRFYATDALPGACSVRQFDRQIGRQNYFSWCSARVNKVFLILSLVFIEQGKGLEALDGRMRADTPNPHAPPQHPVRRRRRRHKWLAPPSCDIAK